MRRAFLLSVICLAWMFGVSPVFAEQNDSMTPVMISLFNPVQFPSEEVEVKGVRLNLLYGQCRGITGLDLGLVNQSTERVVGLQAGFVNVTAKEILGLQVGGVNYSGHASQLQVGLFNGAQDVFGVQIGLINYTYLMQGVQIGLVNVIGNSDIPFFPFINFAF